MNMFEITEEMVKFKKLIDESLNPVEVYDNGIFGTNYKYTIPLFCAENGYKCMYQPSRVLYIIFRGNGDNNWKEI